MPPTSEAYERYTPEQMWVEFWEDRYSEHPEELMVVDSTDGEESHTQFVTGDPEIDDLERRIAAGTITDEEIQATLASWMGVTPEQTSAAEQLAEEIGEGFVETRR